ncbi:restriction endonuclease subunit S [Mesomycoplasma lagogenitalium]|uniref:Restriction endonuclease subunit S n=1 Tax=Mesomycoplasma lagogenitalium TaxID=171286 RepID=A0ABY8LT50_9BACT|nr:restriction endonuclease subunit S [Mesomycoplasma lagogenitalium]WGI36425.1 restriction endonuclease subunit S [Mesomycoplasma lagogenitalium]
MKKFMQLLKNEKVEWKTLGEVCEIKRGKINAKYFNYKGDGKYPVYSSQTFNNGEVGRTNEYDYDGEYITYTTDGAYAGTVFIRQGKFSITRNCGLIYSRSNKLLNKFIGYWLSENTKKYLQGSKERPKLMSGIVSKIKIPIPSLKAQEKIVQILDKLSNLKNELNQKLKIELNSRIKQYEYYRDKLLSEEYLNKITYNLTHDTHTHTHTAKS